MSVLRAATALLGMLGVISAISAGAAPVEAPADLCSRGNDAGEFQQSLAPCAAAVAEARSHPDRVADLAAALNGHGLALEMTGSRVAAEASYLEALELQRRLGAHDQEALVLSNLAALAIGGGDYGRALGWLADEEAVARAAGDESWVEEELRIVRLNRGVVLEQLGAYREALSELRDVAASSGEDSSHDAELTANLAVLYRNAGDPRRALRLLDQAALAFQASGDRAALANVHLNRGLVYALNLDESGNARREYSTALDLARETGDRGEELRTLQCLGDLELAEGSTAEARRAFSSALALSRSSSAAAGEWSALIGLGRTLAIEGRADAALVELRAARAALEKASADVGDAGLASSLLHDQRRLFAISIDLLGERARAGDGASALEALAWSEQLKGRELLDALAGTVASAPLGEAELASFGSRFGTTLAYFVGERTLWRWTIDGHGIAMDVAGDARELESAARRLRSEILRGERPDDGIVRRLSLALLPARLAPGEPLWIVPDGPYFYLPFVLLEEPGAPAVRLVENRLLRLLPSLSVLPRLAHPERSRRWRIAALGATQVAPREVGRSARGPSAILAERYGLPPIPGAGREAKRAIELVGEPSAIDLGPEATEERLRERASEGADVLHLAAHTIVDDSLARGVALFLAAGSQPGDPSDGIVTPAELAALALSADLVVLSGCRTALAPEGAGGRVGTGASGMSSLSGALLAAGAHGVLASLWDVDDATTAALMEQFYFALAQGAVPAAALHQAQLRLAGDPRWSAPLHWAGFVLIGDPPALRSGGAATRVLLVERWAAAILLIAGIALGLFRYRRHQRDQRDQRPQ